MSADLARRSAHHRLSPAYPSLCLILILITLSGCDTRYVRELDQSPDPRVGMGGWVRYNGSGNHAGDLEIAYADYEHPDYDAIVRMVGVIHIADGGYYRCVQEVLDDCDRVLYEGIRSGNQGPPEADPQTRRFWSAISSLIGLRAQVEVIDYARESWIQVDLATVGEEDSATDSPPSLSLSGALLEAVEGLNEIKSELRGLLDLPKIEDGIKHQYAQSLTLAQANSFESLADQIGQFRRDIARLRALFEFDWLEQAEQTLRLVEEEIESIADFIIADRNLFVMQILDEELEPRKKTRITKPTEPIIGVFYGAAHMPDFDQKLQDRGWTRTKREFMRAWSIDKPEMRPTIWAKGRFKNKPRGDGETGGASRWTSAPGADLIGKPFPLKDLEAVGIAPIPQNKEGTLTLVRWWTVGCPFCERTLPAIEKLRLRYAEQGLQTVAVFHPKPPGNISDADIKKFAREIGYRGRLAKDLQWKLLRRAWLDTGDRQATSVSFLIDGQGRIRFIHPGPEYFPSKSPVHADSALDHEKVVKAIEYLLAEAKSI